jgi:hypothetical protein
MFCTRATEVGAIKLWLRAEVGVHLYIYIHTHIYIYIYMRIYIYVCVCVCIVQLACSSKIGNVFTTDSAPVRSAESRKVRTTSSSRGCRQDQSNLNDGSWLHLHRQSSSAVGPLAGVVNCTGTRWPNFGSSNGRPTLDSNASARCVIGCCRRLGCGEPLDALPLESVTLVPTLCRSGGSETTEAPSGTRRSMGCCLMRTGRRHHRPNDSLATIRIPVDKKKNAHAVNSLGGKTNHSLTHTRTQPHHHLHPLHLHTRGRFSLPTC